VLKERSVKSVPQEGASEATMPEPGERSLRGSRDNDENSFSSSQVPIGTPENERLEHAAKAPGAYSLHPFDCRL
jgi:hypothetical protein